VLTVNEIFFSIQGEGTRAGRLCVFVRLTGCPLRCVWCDTAYAFHEGTRRSEDEVMAEVEKLPCRLLELTGGEPLSQPDAFKLVAGPSTPAGRCSWRPLGTSSSTAWIAGPSRSWT
jgi:7-carboxy-7-deazaguanine synthase